MDGGKLSRLQLEGVLHACSKHQSFLADGTRCGFFLGDGAGVGKGRQISGMVLDNYARGRRRSIWLSTSTDLVRDAERDLRDLGTFIPVLDGCQSLDSLKDSKGADGVLFSTYSTLTGVSKGRSRLDQIICWAAGESPDAQAAFNGLIVFDEAHKAKNSGTGKEGGGTKVSQCVLALQQRLPRARVLYASATGISEVGNMAYCDRLGFWGPHCSFPSATAFIDAMKKRGLGFLELLAVSLTDFVATADRTRSAAPHPSKLRPCPRPAARLRQMEMKSEGKYVSRGLAFTVRPRKEFLLVHYFPISLALLPHLHRPASSRPSRFRSRRPRRAPPPGREGRAAQQGPAAPNLRCAAGVCAPTVAPGTRLPRCAAGGAVQRQRGAVDRHTGGASPCAGRHQRSGPGRVEGVLGLLPALLQAAVREHQGAGGGGHGARRAG